MSKITDLILISRTDGSLDVTLNGLRIGRITRDDPSNDKWFAQNSNLGPMRYSHSQLNALEWVLEQYK